MTIANVDNTTLNNLAPNLDVGDVADPALRLEAFQYIYAKMQDLVTEVNNIPTANIQNLSITAAKLADLAVTTGKIADLAVATAKLQDASVTLAKMAANSVGTSQLVDASVTAAKVMDGVLTASKFVAGALTNETQNGLRITALEADLATNVKAFGASGDGVTDDSDAIMEADAVSQALLFANGTFLIESDITITSNVVFNGGKIKPANGVTVTISGMVTADQYDRIFDGSAGGTVYLSGTMNWSFCWFGAYADGSNGSANAIARNHIMRAYDHVTKRMRIVIPPGRYENSGAKDYTDMFVLYKNQTSIVGGGAANTWIKFGFQLAADDTDLVGVTAWTVRYGILMDDESDTDYPQYMGRTGAEDDFPRYGETTRTAQGLTMPGRALRRDVIDCQTFGCAFGIVDIDHNADQYYTNVRVELSTYDGILVFKGFNTGDDMGNLHLSQCIVEDSGRHNAAIYKVGSYLNNNCKYFNTNPTGKESVFIFAKDQSSSTSTGFEVIRQVWFNNTSLEGTATRTLNITAIADAGGGMIQVTLDSPHYIDVGHFFGNITGTTSYNYVGAVVNSVVSSTQLVLAKQTGSFTFGTSETGQFVLPQIDLWMEGEETTNKRIMFTEIVGGDVNSFVLKNLRNCVMSSGIIGKQSGYIRTCQAVSAFLPIGFNRNSKVSDTRYWVGFTRWNIDTASEVYREGWYDEYNEGYYATQNGTQARIYDYANGQWQRVGISQSPKIGTFAEYNHGVAEVGRQQVYGRDSAGNKTAYYEVVVSCQDDTDGSEDAVVSFNYPIAGGSGSKWSMRRGFYYTSATGGDPATPGACNFTGYYANGTAGVDGSFTTADGKTVTVTKGIITSIV